MAESIIYAKDLHKHFRVAKHGKGFLGALRGLVSFESREVRAVAGMSFRILFWRFGLKHYQSTGT